jgi:hypothetical protein
MASQTDLQTLRYLDACCVEHPAGTLAGIVVWRDDVRIGEIGGILLEPASRRVRYFVVERLKLLRTRRYLVPTDCAATLHAEDGTIYIDAADSVIDRFDLSAVPRFSDDDLIQTLFARPAA